MKATVPTKVQHSPVLSTWRPARQSGKATSINVTISQREGHEAKGRGAAHHQVYPAEGRKAALQATKGNSIFPDRGRGKVMTVEQQCSPITPKTI